MLEGGAYRSDSTMLVQDATAEESEAYSLTTQADPVMTAASEEEEATSAAAVVTTTAAAVVLGTSTAAEVEEVEEAARVAVTKVVGELEVLVATGTAAAVLVEATTTAAAVVVGSDAAYQLLVSLPQTIYANIARIAYASRVSRPSSIKTAACAGHVLHIVVTSRSKARQTGSGSHRASCESSTETGSLRPGGSIRRSTGMTSGIITSQN